MSFYHRGFDESIIKELLAFVKHKEEIFGTDLFKINKTYIESIDRTFYYCNFEMERVGMYKSWTSCLKIGIKAEHAWNTGFWM